MMTQEDYEREIAEERAEFALARAVIEDVGVELSESCPRTFVAGDGNGGWLMELFARAIGVGQGDPVGATNRPSRSQLSTTKSLAVFAADGYACQRCGTREGLTVDHKLPVSKGGTNDIENLWTLCKPCNSAKGTRTVEEWLP